MSSSFREQQHSATAAASNLLVERQFQIDQSEGNIALHLSEYRGAKTNTGQQCDDQSKCHPQLMEEEYDDFFDFHEICHSWKEKGHLQPNFQLLLRLNQAMKSKSIRQKKILNIILH